MTGAGAGAERGDIDDIGIERQVGTVENVAGTGKEMNIDPLVETEVAVQKGETGGIEAEVVSDEVMSRVRIDITKTTGTEVEAQEGGKEDTEAEATSAEMSLVEIEETIGT